MSHTPGPWYGPHLADDAVECNCKSIVCESYAGSICIVSLGNGLLVSDGGNDCPPLEEAKANGRLIAAAPDLLAALKGVLRVADRKTDEFDAARAAIAKATA